MEKPKTVMLPRMTPATPSGQPGTGAYSAPIRGEAEPLGPSLIQGGSVNLAVYASGATSVTLCLFTEADMAQGRTSHEIPLDPNFNRTGDVWHMQLSIYDSRLLYGYRIGGPNQDEVPEGESPDLYFGHSYNEKEVVLDPYARMVIGRRKFGELAADHLDYESPDVLGLAPTWSQHGCALPTPEQFDWEGDRPLNLPMEETVIYEMHVRGFTADPSSGTLHPGTYESLTQKLDYIASLGVTAVELLPIQDFNELEYYQITPGAPLRFNFWGYSTCSFFSPMSRYSAAAATGGSGAEISAELKQFVKETHRRGMEVILDVVFNHTAEGNEMGPSISFRGLDNRVYYMLAPEGQYYNYSGCGNTFNCNHPVVRRFIVDCLRFWVTEYHIDGFRFDLASILTRANSSWKRATQVNEEGEVMPSFAGDGGKGGALVIDEGVMSNGAGVPTGTPLAEPPLIEEISQDPVLMNTKLIAEAWDCDGLNQVGAFPHYNGRWAEWNGNFRDTVRQFMKGTDGPWAGSFAEVLCGSPSTYGNHNSSSWWAQNAGQQWVGGRGPIHSVNFITAHDGFTLADLVSYNEKRNSANGEDNNDGEQHNLSWNCGAEGPTDNTKIQSLRGRQMRNFMAALLMAQGVPMILMGDEYGHTKDGNNNTYCHDNHLNWLDWNRANADTDGLRRFVSHLIKFRRRRPELGLAHFPDGNAIQWHGVNVHEPDWSDTSRLLALTLSTDSSNYARRGLYICWNASHLPQTVQLPQWEGSVWQLVADSSKPAPFDFLAVDDVLSEAEVIASRKSAGMWIAEGCFPMLPRSVVILESVPEDQDTARKPTPVMARASPTPRAQPAAAAPLPPPPPGPTSSAPPNFSSEAGKRPEPAWKSDPKTSAGARPTAHPSAPSPHAAHQPSTTSRPGPSFASPPSSTASDMEMTDEERQVLEENRRLRQKAIEMGLIKPGADEQ